ncbi:MAG: HEPN domain-containing protein [Sedimenticola sp.]
MAKSKAYKKFIKCHDRAIGMIRIHHAVWREFHENVEEGQEWEEANDDLFRAGIVLSVSAMDAYFTDRFCESLIPFIKKNGLNKNLEKLLCDSGFSTWKAIEMLENKRPKRVLSNMVKRHLSMFVTQNFKAIDSLYKCYGFNDSFTKNAQGISKRKNLLSSLSKIIDRRHKIVHAGDYNQYGNLRSVDYSRMLRKILELRKLIEACESLLDMRKI